MRPTDQETIAIEKVTYYIDQSQKEGACHAIQRGTRVGQEAEGARGKCGQESLLWFPWQGMGEAG